MNKNEKLLFNSHLTLTGFEQSRILNIVSGDKTRLEFTLKDKNNTPIELGETTGQAQIVDSRGDVLVAVFDVEVSGSQASFTLDKALPALDYELYLKVGDYYFPSREDSFMLRVIEAYDVVSDIDVESVQTIDIVVDALRADIIEALKPEVVSYVDQIIEAEPERFRGEKGDAFTVNDFTDEQFNNLRGSDGEPFVFENFTAEQLDDLRLTIVSSVIDEGGNTTVTFNDGSTLIIPKGVQGERGLDGDSVTFESLTPEQKSELTGHQGLSAYQLAVQEGFVGSEYEWLETLKGQDGQDGTDGQSFDYESLTTEQKAEIKGEQGDKGDSFEYEDFTQEQLDELRGVDGADGKSSYELALEIGYEGSLEEYLQSLHGIDGNDGTSLTWDDLTPEQINSLKGKDGYTVDIAPITDEEENEIGYEIIVTTPNEETVSSGVIYHGKDLIAKDLTEEQLQAMSIKIVSEDKDELGNTLLTFSDGTTITVSKGDRGESGVDGLHGNTTSVEDNEDGSYDIIVANPNSETEISRTTVRDGVDGTDGTDGESLRYEDLTPEQIAELQEGLPVRPPKIYTRAEYDALDSYDPHTLYFVVEEDEIPQ